MDQELLTYETANTWWAGFMYNDRLRTWARLIIQKRVARKVKKYKKLCAYIEQIARSRGRAEAN